MRTVLRVDSPKTQERYNEFVDKVIFPEGLGALATVSAITGGDLPDAVEQLTGVLDILQVRVTGHAPIAGKSLQDVSLPDGGMIVVNMTEQRIIRPTTVVEPGMNLLVAVEPTVSKKIVAFLTDE